MATPTHAGSKRLKAVGAAAHRFFFFAPGISRLSWALLGRIFRYRPFLTTLDRALHLDGDVIECGVFWGRSLILIAGHLKKSGKSAKKVFGLDSFDGFRDESVSACDVGANRTLDKVLGRFKQDSSIVPRLRRLALRLGLNVEVAPGYFEDTLPSIIKDRTFCFVHLDCDIYSSYKTCLSLLYPRLVAGGIMLFDEYRSPVWPGATQAIDEFFRDKPEKPQVAYDAGRPKNPKYYVVKHGLDPH